MSPADLRLTPREVEVLAAYASGCVSGAEVARALGISVGTVRCHEANVREKLNVRSTMQAVLKAVGAGLVGSKVESTE